MTVCLVARRLSLLLRSTQMVPSKLAPQPMMGQDLVSSLATYTTGNSTGNRMASTYDRWFPINTAGSVGKFPSQRMRMPMKRWSLRKN